MGRGARTAVTAPAAPRGAGHSALAPLARDAGPRVSRQGAWTVQEWTDDAGRLHRLDGPARVRSLADGQRHEEWLVRGVHHRADGPAVVVFDALGRALSEAWYAEGEQHRLDGPARRSRYDDGQLQSEEWWQFGHLHRDDAPAAVRFHPNAVLAVEEWRRRSRLDRVDGPAEAVYDREGHLVRATWARAGQLHRDDGPAVWRKAAGAARADTEYWRQGQRVTRAGAPLRR